MQTSLRIHHDTSSPNTDQAQLTQNQSTRSSPSQKDSVIPFTDNRPEARALLQQKKRLTTVNTAIQKKIDVADKPKLSALAERFFSAVRRSGGLPALILEQAAGNPNLFLKIEGAAQLDSEDKTRGFTTVSVGSNSLGKWVKLREATPQDWVQIKTGPKVAINLAIRYHAAETDRMEELYSLVHEFAVHALRFWPTLEKILANRLDELHLDGAFNPDGPLHQNQHHQEVAHESNPDFEQLFRDVYSIICHEENLENAAKFSSHHVTDIYTQLVTPAQRETQAANQEIVTIGSKLRTINFKDIPSNEASQVWGVINHLDNAISTIKQAIQALAKIHEDRTERPQTKWSSQALKKIQDTIKDYHERRYKLEQIALMLRKVHGDDTFTPGGAVIGNDQL